MRSLKHNIIDVSFNDDIGDYTIHCRPLTWKEQIEVMDLQDQLTKTRDKQQIMDSSHELFKLLAYPNGICLDPELTLQFWQGGQFAVDVPLVIFSTVLQEGIRSIKDTRSFRRK